MRRAVFLSSPAVWERGHGAGHPLKPERLRRTHELLDELGLLDTSTAWVVRPEVATADDLALFHRPEYVEAVRALSAGQALASAWSYGFGPGDNPAFTGMFESEGRKVGSALMAARLLVEERCDVAFSYSGGLHHAGPAQASGFCVFNDAAVAIQWLLGQGRRVAYVDVDVHHGDGVQAAFYDTDQVLTISLHQDGRTLFPGTGFVDEVGVGAGTGFSVNVPLPPYTDDELYLWAFRRAVPPLLRRFRADIVVTQLGVDTHFRDPLANLALTTHGQDAVFWELSHLAPRWLALGGGGYDMDVVPRSWALAFSVMCSRPLPEELPAGYRARYGGRWIHDRERPGLSAGDRRWVQERVHAVVEKTKRIHGIEE